MKKFRQMIGRRTLIAGSMAGLVGCANEKVSRRYNGPKATGIVVRKGERKMFVLKGNEPLATYDVELGLVGDGRTPEGRYFIDRRNYNSAFYLSLGISYPNAKDRARARERGVDPGGDIFIHGQPNGEKRDAPDWTAGCISVSNREMQKIYQMVPVGIPIWIEA